MHEDLYRLVYRSAFAVRGEPGAGQALDAILDAARRNNSRAGLTGALLHSGTHFVQVLEGPMAPVEATFDRIATDFRHSAIELLQFAPVGAQIFPAWTMAYVPQPWIEGLLDLGTIREDVAPDGLDDVLRRLARLLSDGSPPK